MAENGISSGNMGAESYLIKQYPLENVSLYCDNSWTRAVKETASFFSPKSAYENFPINLIIHILKSPLYIVNGFVSVVSSPANIYHYLTRNETSKETACREISEHGIELFDRIDVLGRNALGDAIEKNSTETAMVYALGGVNLKQRAFDLGNVLHQVAIKGDLELLEVILNSSRFVNVDAKDGEGLTPIHLAASFGNFLTFKTLLDAGANPEVVDKKGRTPVLLAAQNCVECFKLLLERGVNLLGRDGEFAGLWHYAAANPNSDAIMSILSNKNIPSDGEDVRGQTAMHYAALNGNANAIDNLVYYKFNPNKQDFSGLFPIHLAAKLGHADVIHRLAVAGANVDAIDVPKQIKNKDKNSFPSNAETALHYCAKEGHLDAIGALLANKASVNFINKYGETPLNLAAKTQNSAGLLKLINAGANVNHIPVSGMSPLYEALKRGHSEVAEILRENGGIIQSSHSYDTRLLDAVASNDFDKVQELMLEGAPLNARDFDRQTPLMIATIIGNTQIIDSLLDAGVNELNKGILHVLDTKDRTALHLAAQNVFDKKILNKLIERGGNHLLPDFKGRTPLHYAVESNNLEAVEVLSSLRYDGEMGIDIEDKNGNTPLHEAVQLGYLEIANKLITAGAIPTLVNTEGKSPLHLAAINGDEAIIQLLLNNDESGINWKDHDGNTALYYSAKGNHHSVSGILMAHGAKIHLENYDPLQIEVLKGGDLSEIEAFLNQNAPIVAKAGGNTALHTSIQVGENKVASALINHVNSTVLNYRNALGETPLILAAQMGETETLIKLIQSGAEINVRNNKYETPLHLAAQNGDVGAVFALALAGANLAAPDKFGLTPLGFAIRQNQELVINLLLELGAHKFENKDPSFQSIAFLNMINSGNFQKVQEFLLRGVNINVTDQDGWGALHFAVIQSSTDILESLIEAGLTITADKRGQTPLHLATAFKNTEAMKILLKNIPEIKAEDLFILLKVAQELDNQKLVDIIESKLSKLEMSIN